MAATIDNGTSPKAAPPSPAFETCGTTKLEDLVSKTKRCAFKPAGFFVSWQGVVTLAYKGFPDAILNLKAELAEHHSSLPKENPGSKWPKTTLGCVKDNKRLTPAQLEKLLTICREESGFFQHPQSPKSQMVLVDKLAVVVYECRSLERRLSNRVVDLLPDADLADPCADELARTEAVLAEAEAPDYWVAASKDGNREGHYRGAALGATLVHDLEAFKAGASAAFGNKLPGIVKRFRHRVEQELPGMYTWFEDDALHVTIRAICG